MWQSPDFFIFRLFLLSKGLRRRAVADVGPLRVIRLSVDHPHAAHFIVIPDSFFQGLAVGVISRLSRLRCVNRRFSVAGGFLRGSEYLETVCFIPCRFFHVTRMAPLYIFTVCAVSTCSNFRSRRSSHAGCCHCQANQYANQCSYFPFHRSLPS